MKKVLTLLIVLMLGILPGRAYNDITRDSVEFSLLTCTPSSEVYALYGHTAIRYQNFTTGDDWVFNYGMFDFSSDSFIWRFTKGECDYVLGILPYDIMEREYRERQSGIYAQILNLSSVEKNNLLNLLLLNYQPENRRYRYNIFDDNCTTRARDQIERAIQGKVVYDSTDRQLSYRQILHKYTAGSPWAELGNDLCLGVEADLPITERQEMFAPFFMKDYAATAYIVSEDGGRRPLVLEEKCLFPDTRIVESCPWYLSPEMMIWSLFAAILLLGVVQYRKNRIYWGVDVFLQVIVTLMGIVVSLLFFFSEHPTVGSNWQIILLNPLILLLLPREIYCAIRKKFTHIHEVILVWLIFFIIFSICTTQDFSNVVVPLALILWIRSLGYILYYRKNGIRYNKK